MLENIAQPLLKWYDKNKRTLPWRDKNNAYYTWVSEIILQQTFYPGTAGCGKSCSSTRGTHRETMGRAWLLQQSPQHAESSYPGDGKI